jgi:hypothetical protein
VPVLAGGWATPDRPASPATLAPPPALNEHCIRSTQCRPLTLVYRWLGDVVQFGALELSVPWGPLYPAPFEGLRSSLGLYGRPALRSQNHGRFGGALL